MPHWTVEYKTAITILGMVGAAASIIGLCFIIARSYLVQPHQKKAPEKKTPEKKTPEKKTHAPANVFWIIGILIFIAAFIVSLSYGTFLFWRLNYWFWPLGWPWLYQNTGFLTFFSISSGILAFILNAFWNRGWVFEKADTAVGCLFFGAAIYVLPLLAILFITSEAGPPDFKLSAVVAALVAIPLYVICIIIAIIWRIKKPHVS